MAAKPQRATIQHAEAEAPPPGAAASLRSRLAAWWEGKPAPHTAPPAQAATSARAAGPKPVSTAKAASAAVRLWPAERIGVATLLWGEGFVTPLGAEAMVALAAPLALQPKEVLLDAAAGLGGPARALSEHYHVRVNAMDPSAELAAAGTALSEKLGTGKEFAVAAYDPHKGELKRGAAAALVRELVFTLDDKEALLRRVLRALKTGGRLLVADYVLVGREPGPAVAAWAAADPAPVKPWGLDHARKCLAKLNVDVTATSDETARLGAALAGGLDAFVKGAAARALSPAQARLLSREIAIWALRKAAIDAGEIRFVSLTGVKSGEPG